MKRLEKVLIAAIILVAIVTAFYLLTNWISVTTGYAIKSDDPGIVGQCLGDRGVIAYTSPNCPACGRQANELKEVISNIDVVDCSQNAQSCLVLSQLPAIEYQDNFYYGFKTFEEVREITNC